MHELRLPRQLNEDPRGERLPAELAAHSEPLWAGAEFGAVEARLEPGLEDALIGAQSSGRIVRGFDGADRALAADELGLRQADRKAGVARGGRVSRLLVLSDDGSERFYRNAEALLRRHRPRVLALRLITDECVLGELLFGPDERARLLLVEHKDAVSAVLLALADQWAPNG